MSSFFSKGSGKSAGCPTPRAPDVWDSAAFSSIFLASSFSCSRTESQPAHTQVTQTVGGQSQNQMQNRLWFANKFSGSRLLFNSISFIGKVFVWLHRVAKISIKVFWLWYRSTLVFVRGRFCRLLKSACFLFAKFQVRWVCKIILALLVVVVL